MSRLIDLSDNPADRLWRYPICRAVVKLAAHTPLTPNHVTALHGLCGLAAGIILSQGTKPAFVAAGILFELRSILDCFDGVLARVTGRSSPFGRAFDQLADTVGFVSLMAGGLVCFGRLYGYPVGLAIVLATMAISASCSTAWDLYRRRFQSLLSNGYDTTEDEFVELCLRYAERPMVSLWVSKVVGRWSWYTLSPDTLPRLKDRVARADWPVKGAHAVTPLGRAVQDAAARQDPALRRALGSLGIVAGDNIILLLTVGLLAGQYLVAFPIAMVWGIFVWLHVVGQVKGYLAAAAPHGDEHFARG